MSDVEQVERTERTDDEVERDLLGHAPSRSVWDCGCAICERAWLDD